VQCLSCGHDNQSFFTLCLKCGADLMPTKAQLPKVDTPPKTDTVADDSRMRRALTETKAVERNDTSADCRPTLTTAAASLVRLRRDGTDGIRLPLREGTQSIGSEDCDIILLDDAWIDPYHADITVNTDTIAVQDNGSLNGVYVAIAEPVPIEHGDCFMIGQNVLQFESLTEDSMPLRSEDEDTLPAGSPCPEMLWGRLVTLMENGDHGEAHLLQDECTLLGRSAQTPADQKGPSVICYEDDGYVSALHARIVRTNLGAVVEDTGSSNGTFVRIKTTAHLGHGDRLLIGHHVFRLHEE
jgi:pSer/pThr/pTyr-binding forkhead associated (FHA) protein